jgi:hypothetical protein
MRTGRRVSTRAGRRLVAAMPRPIPRSIDRWWRMPKRWDSRAAWVHETACRRGTVLVPVEERPRAATG